MAKVYIKINDKNEIISINSDVFIKDVSNYIFVDEGVEDKYIHAQSNYLSKSLVDEYDRYNFKYINNEIVEVNDSDKEQPNIASSPTIEDRLSALEGAMLEVVLGGIE